jgi:hypothetical protein
MWSAVAFIVFALVALVGPGVAWQRLARVSAEPAIVLPLGGALAAGAYWLSLVTGQTYLFPVLVLAFNLPLLMRAQPYDEADETASEAVRGALPAIGATLLMLALTQYPFNRPAADGEFRLHPLVPFDTAFHVGVTRELTLGYPPQVPGIAGFPLAYHLGLDLVRAAALQWAGVDPYDAISRWDVTLWAIALILALRRVTALLGAPPLAVQLAGFAPLLGDFSFLFARNPQAHWWTDLLRGNLLLSLAFANPVVPALALALGVLIALSRYEEGRRGWLLLAAAQSAAVAFFKVFLGAQLALGLAVAALLRRERRPAFALSAALALGTTALLALSPAAHSVDVTLAPLDLVRITRETLSMPPVHGRGLVAWTALWIFASLGLRWLGLPAALRSLRSGGAVAVALAAMALCAWPIGLLLRVAPPDAVVGQKAINDVAFMLEQGGVLLWIFTAIALAGLARRWRPLPVIAATALLALPSSVHFVLKTMSFPADALPAPTVRAMAALAAVSRPGDVVLQRPGARYPPAPVVLIGRRVPYERFTPYLTQFGAKADLERRHEIVYRFFHTADAVEAATIARSLDARFLCLYGPDRVWFELKDLYEPVYEEAEARVYRMKSP